MTETFYSVFGVGPDADGERIERAYRQAVKECHPDVSDDPAAAERFKRLTAAREVLLDEDERAQYDRLGHAAYVRRYLDCPAWSVPTDQTASNGDHAHGDAEPTDEGPSGNESQSDDGTPRQTATTTGRTSAHRAATDAGRGARTGGRTSGSRSRPTETRAASEPESGVWAAQPTGATPRRRRRAGPLDRLASVLAGLGPWLVAHAAFLGLAVWTAQHWLATEYGTTGPGLALIGLELLIAVAVSAVHLASVSTG